jgi:hypothetical protein
MRLALKYVLVMVLAALPACWAGTSFAAPLPPFTQCPAIGASPSCMVLIDITDSGAVALFDPTMLPYDDAFDGDDSLVGVLNESSRTVERVHLSGLDIFVFDGDGICSPLIFFSYPAWSGSENCPYGATGYEGPRTSFAVENDALGTINSGFVNFDAPLAPGESTFFALESNLLAPDVNFTATTPLPRGLVLLSVGTLTLGIAAWRRRSA